MHQVKAEQCTANEMSNGSWEQQTKETAANGAAPEDTTRQRKQTEDKDVASWMQDIHEGNEHLMLPKRFPQWIVLQKLKLKHGFGSSSF